MPTDHHQNQAEGLTSPYNDAAAAQCVLKQLDVPYVGSQGNLTVRMAGSGNDVQFTLDKHEMLPLRVVRVLATGTTCTNIVALW